jgi:hypothetical protein
MSCCCCWCAAGAVCLHAQCRSGRREAALSKEVETRQQTERYLIETRNQLTDSLREIEQLKAQLAYKETDIQAAVAAPSRRCRWWSVFARRCWARAGRGDRKHQRSLSDRGAGRAQSHAVDRQALQLELDPKSSTDFGHLEGWQFASGDEVGLFNDEFGALRITVP